MTEHETFMQRCIELAQEAKTRGDVPVGSLVAKADVIIAEASERMPASLDITGHAELLALQIAARLLYTMDLSGCTLYTTAEPCRKLQYNC